MVRCDYSFVQAWSLKLSIQIFIKTHLKNEVTPSKKIGDFPTKIGGKDGSVLSFARKYYRQATYHLNVEAISFPIT